MTELRQRMLEELQRRNYSKETIRLYLFAVKDFARHFKKRPDLLRQEHMREFQLHLPNERKLAVETVAARITALRFFFVKVLHRPYQELDLIYPKLPVRLPTVLSEDEVAKLIESASSAYHRTIVGISGVPVVESRQAAGRECRIWSFMIWAAQERAISRVTQQEITTRRRMRWKPDIVSISWKSKIRAQTDRQR